MANYRPEKFVLSEDSDNYILSIPSPPYSEDGNDENERLNFDPVELQHDGPNLHAKLLIKSSTPKKNKNISKNKSFNKNKNLNKNFIESIKKHNQKEFVTKSGSGSLSKSSFAKIYPNLLKINVNDSKIKCSPGSVSNSNYHENIKKRVRCFMCHKSVENIHMKDHLFFGKLECRDCGRKEINCCGFSEHFKTRKGMEREGCQHKNLIWPHDPLKFIKKNLIKMNNSLLYENKMFNDILQHYLESLAILWDIKPWNSAIDPCRIYLSSSNSCSSKPTEVKKPFEDDHLLDLPDDGRYYICKEVLEECRDCYAILNAKDFVFNVSTALITTKCRECELPIYFVLNPPNGAKHFVKILQ